MMARMDNRSGHRFIYGKVICESIEEYGRRNFITCVKLACG